MKDIVLCEVGEEVLLFFWEVTENAGVVGFGKDGGVETGNEIGDFAKGCIFEVGVGFGVLM